MKSPIKHLVLIASLLLVQAAAQAGGCRLEEVTQSKALTSTFLSRLIKMKLKEIDDKMPANQKLKVVMIARSGESLANFDIIKDDASVPLQTSLDRLSSAAKENAERNAQYGGKNIRNSSTVEVPKNLKLPGKLAYSHFGLLIRTNPSDQAAPAFSYMVHLLAECDEKSKRYGDSDIIGQAFEEFFWDTKMLNVKAGNNKALVVVPTAELQERLYRLITDKQVRCEMHEEQYNVAAVPFVLRKPGKSKKSAPDYHQLKDQNSNQWPLEMIAAATQEFGKIKNRREAQDVLMSTNYRPSLLDPTGVKESVACSVKRGPFGMWDISNLLNCNDQVFRGQNIMQLITVNSLVEYMTRNDLLANDASTASKKAMYEVEMPYEKVLEYDKAGKTLEKLNGMVQSTLARDGKGLTAEEAAAEEPLNTFTCNR